tara:strand:+ start:118 stop:408 length:291 start_codon:yes stop_codon:yes gene_type:complete
MEEPIVQIRFTQSEVKLLINALTALKTIILPIDFEWKIPYKMLRKQLIDISREFDEQKKMNNVKNQAEERGSMSVADEIAKAQGTFVAGCRGNDCD